MNCGALIVEQFQDSMKSPEIDTCAKNNLMYFAENVTKEKIKKGKWKRGVVDVDQKFMKLRLQLSKLCLKICRAFALIMHTDAEKYLPNLKT